MNSLLLNYDPCDLPVGGVDFIEILPTVAIESMAIPSGLAFVGPLNLVSGWQWLRVEFVKGTGFFAEKDSESPQGTVYEKRVGGFFARDNRATTETLEKMKRYYWVVRFEDGDGRWRLLGSQSQVMRLVSREYESSTPEKSRGFLIEFVGDMSRPAFFDER